MYFWSFLVLSTLCIAFNLRGVLSETDCERHREQQQRSSAPVRWDIQCDGNGDYKPLQCTVDSPKWCTCYRKDGTLITQPSRSTKTCTCYTDKDDKEKNAASPCDIPKCQRSGKYEKKQCCSTTGKCHCVDENTGARTTEPRTGSVTC